MTKVAKEKDIKLNISNNQTKKKVANKSTKKKTTKTKSTKNVSTTVEYYDLPLRYNQTIVKILAQTPNILFIYWDVSEDDKNAFIKKYGPNFFSNTKPYLIVTNKTKNYTVEVEIDDFANSWYLHINDADCIYKVELCRKFIAESANSKASESDNSNTYVEYKANDNLSITSSNKVDMPNNHILFDELGKSVFFRNVKTNIITEKELTSISYMQNIGKVYNIYDLYKEIYKNELISDEFELNLPSSNSSSSFK